MARILRWSVFTMLGLALLGIAAQEGGQDPRTRAAVRKGVQYLRSRQMPDGRWQFSHHDVGMTALCALALIENGVALSDPALSQAHGFITANAASNPQTYDVSLAIIFLVRAGQESDRALIGQLTEQLKAGQLATGGWTYALPTEPPAASAPAQAVADVRRRPDANRRRGGLRTREVFGHGYGDNSNTQFAVLALWSASRVGIDVKDAMDAVDIRFRKSQSQYGGWGYNAPNTDTPSMTCAGLMSLVLAKAWTTVASAQMANRKRDGTSHPEPAEKLAMPSDAQIDRGIARAAHYAALIGPGSDLYFLWSVERLCVALGARRLGNVDWYERGAEALVRTQQPNGMWKTGFSEQSDTAFALLFLRRANLTQGMPRLVTKLGGAATTGPQMRPGSLQELIQTVRTPGDSDEPHSGSDLSLGKPKSDAPAKPATPNNRE